MSTDIIGLTGHAGSGKDTAAAHLIEHYGYRRFAFADALKDAALRINPYIFDDERLAPLVAEHGMDFVKRVHPEARRFLQELGVAMREIDDDIWLRAFHDEAELGGRIVITDVRFDNEAAAVRWWGGDVIELTRPGHALEGAAGQHESEQGIPRERVDYAIVNDGTRADLYAALERYMDDWV